MFALPFETRGCCGRVRLRGWTAAEDAWLVETKDANVHDEAAAKSPQEAVTWLRTFVPEVEDATIRAIEDGRTLLVLHSVPMPMFDGPPQGVSLTELAGDPLVPAPEPVEEEAPEWVDVRIVDRKGRPRAGVFYELTLPDASVKRGRTNAQGHIRVENVHPIGDCSIRFPELDAPMPAPAPAQAA